MSTTLKIDFVSDVVCPWCVIGLRAMRQALEHIGDSVHAEIRIEPFELNPQMPLEGQDIAEHIAQKYGSSPEDLARNQEGIRARGEQLGFTFDMGKRARIYNTFDAHRLLHWAAQSGQQLALKERLFAAYFTEGRNPSDRTVLVKCAGAVGLDEAEALRMLESDEYAEEVREREAFFQQRGIHAVPSVIIEDRYLIQGGQPVEIFERALRQIAAEAQKRGEHS